MLASEHPPKLALIEALHGVGPVFFLGVQHELHLAEAAPAQFTHHYVLIDLLFAVTLS